MPSVIAVADMDRDALGARWYHRQYDAKSADDGERQNDGAHGVLPFVIGLRNRREFCLPVAAAAPPVTSASKQQEDHDDDQNQFHGEPLSRRYVTTLPQQRAVTDLVDGGIVQQLPAGQICSRIVRSYFSGHRHPSSILRLPVCDEPRD
jgi:hypothetical protein